MRVAIATLKKNRAAFRPFVLPASQSHKTAVDADASAPYPHQDREFAHTILNFLSDEVLRKWGEFCDSVTW
jgi:hypothetical protein